MASSNHPNATAVGISDPVYQAYQILHWGFSAVPLIAGIDKFTRYLVAWPMYLSPLVARTTGLPAVRFMYIAGLIEIVAGIIVAIKPRLGAYIVAAWLWAIIINLFLVPGYYDIAVRDFGLSLGALALARLSPGFERV